MDKIFWIFFIFLIPISFYDIKTRLIHKNIFYTLILCIFLLCPIVLWPYYIINTGVSFTSIGGIKLLLERYRGDHIFGWGDVKLLSICLSFCSNPPLLLIISGLLGVIFLLLTHCKSIPFAPFLLLAWILVKVLSYAYQLDIWVLFEVFYPGFL